MTTADLFNLFKADAPAILSFRFKGDTVKYECSNFTFNDGKVDVTKSITVGGDMLLFLRRITPKSVSFGRYYCGKEISIFIPFNKIQSEDDYVKRRDEYLFSLTKQVAA